MISPRSVRLSKSKIAAFEHCPRRLWLQIHRREAGKLSSDTLERFRFGHEVGRQATAVIPDGVMVSGEPDMQAAIERTAKLMRRQPRQAIFEATFEYEGVLVRVDILEPGEGAYWRAIEVKATRRVKSYHLADLATQLWVMQGCGVQISKAIIRHLAQSVRLASFCGQQVQFVDADVSRIIKRYVRTRSAVAAAARQAVEGAEVVTSTGSQCQKPFACEFMGYCDALEKLPLLKGVLPI